MLIDCRKLFKTWWKILKTQNGIHKSYLTAGGAFWMNIFFTLIAAVVGGILFLKLKIPAGAMLGSLFGVAVLSILTGYAYMPVQVKFFAQTIAGCFIGSRVTRADVIALKKMIVPAIVTMFLMFSCCLVMGIGLHFVSGHNFTTALFSTAPGGLSDMVIIALDTDGDVAAITMFQTIRLICAIAFFPPLFNFFFRKAGLIPGKPTKKTQEILEEKEPIVVKFSRKKNFFQFLLTMTIAFLAGGLGSLSGIPAGVMMFSMVSSALQNIFLGNAFMPTPFKIGAQMLTGSLTGETITISVLQTIGSIVIPAAFTILGHIFITFLMAVFLSKKGKIDIVTALYCCVPGGASDMGLIAEDLGAKASTVSLFQLFRSVTVVALYPAMITIFELWIN